MKKTFSQWSEDHALRLAAALAYYSTFSIAPLLVIAIGVAGWFFGPEAARGQLDEQLRGTIGPEAAQAVATMIKSASKPSSTITATILGLVTLLLGASGVFGQLKDALNTVWEVQTKSGQGIKGFIHDRLLSFGMVLVIGFLLLVSLVLSTVMAAFSQNLSNLLPLPHWVWTVAEFVISFGIITLLFAMIFKLLPDAKIEWQSVWIGAAVTALLFEIGKQLLALYLGHQGSASPYGAATSVVLLLLWVYYASCILLFGAEFTQVYATASGHQIVPNKFAEPVTAQIRVQQGLSPGKESVPPEVEVVEVPVYTPPPAPAYPHSFAEVPGYLKESPAAALIAAVGCGYAVGILARKKDPLTPVQEITHGTRNLALAAIPIAAHFTHRMWKEAERRLDVKSLWKACFNLAS